MKTLIKSLLILTLIYMVSSCKDLDKLNVDPNNPAVVPTSALMNGAERKMMDFIYDNWFSGRQALPYAQYWAQRTYTEEDRYQIRETVNNNYFNHLYTIAGNLDKIEKINADPATKVAAATDGPNDVQIAEAKILKIWLMQVIADTWGSVPYSEAFKLEEGIVYPKYDDLNVLYPGFIAELNTAIELLKNSDGSSFNGDLIYGGDPVKWRKFANSLKCRLALRMSKVDPNWKATIAEAVADGVFTSNADNAVFSYGNASPNQSFFYKGFFVDARNDFSITKPFVDLLKGQKDTLNEGKTHPWEGVEDPRLHIFTTPRGGAYIGLPYGLMSSQMNSAIRNASPNFYAGGVVEDGPMVVQAAFTVPFMTYAEVCFILSEYNNFSSDDYLKGIQASFDYWNDNYTKSFGVKENPIEQSEIDAYIAAVDDNVNAETVATQKYIHLYMCGTEAWAEYRRTGYPNTLLKPGENSYYRAGANLVFTPITDTKGDIPARVKYPTNESTLNGESFNAAVAKIGGENNYHFKMFWDVRSKENPHPANK